MINKFKDFLKNKLSRAKSSDESSGPHFDEDLVDDDSNLSNSDRTLNTRVSDIDDTNAGQSTSNFDLSRLKVKTTFGDRFRDITNKIPRRFKEAKANPTAGKVEAPKSRPVYRNNPNKTIKLGKFDILTLNEKLLQKQSRESIQQLFIIGFIFTATYAVGKLTALGLKGAPPLTSTKVTTETIDLSKDFQSYSLASVRVQNIFRTNTGLGLKKTKVADTKCDKADEKSGLPITLLNTIVLQDSIKSLASVQVRSGGESKEFREGDTIDNIAKIFKISRLELIIKNLESGTCEYIQNEKMKQTRGAPLAVMSPAASKNFLQQQKKMKGIENDGNKYIISKALLDEKLKDISAILTQARAIKIQNPDGTMAFKMTEMDPEGVFSYLGIQDQDIITSINGKPITDLNEIMGLFGRIKNLDNLQLGVRREGSDSNLEYSIKK